MYKYKMLYEDMYSPFYNINKYIDTYVINNCISALRSCIAIKELCMARDGGKLGNLDYSGCLTLINLLFLHKLYNALFSILIWCKFCLL